MPFPTPVSPRATPSLRDRADDRDRRRARRCRGYTAIAEWAARLTQSQLKRLRARYNPCTARFEPPSEPTIRRILQSADVARVDASLSDWLLGLTEPTAAVAVDGKTLRGAVREDASQVHLLSAFLHDQGITVAQREIPAEDQRDPRDQAIARAA